MARIKSAAKAQRQSEARRSRNRANRSRLRTAVKSLRTALAAGDAAAAKQLLPGTLSLIDRSVKLGVLHDNAADRTKARLTRAYNKLAAPGS